MFCLRYFYFNFLFICLIISFILEVFLKYGSDLLVSLHLSYVSKEMNKSFVFDG